MAKRFEPNDFGKIFQQYKDKVFKTAYLIVGNVQEAEDILQDVFIKVYKSTGSYDVRKGSMGTWLHRITVNHCISQKRKRRLTEYSSDRMEERGVELADSSEEQPEELLIKDEESGRIWRLVKSMDEKHRSVLSLRYHEGLSYGEIAEVLDIPLGTVKSRINVAIVKLRKRMIGSE
ncbi:RNA polymerase sigma factor [Chloroflexota bacterium]